MPLTSDVSLAQCCRRAELTMNSSIVARQTLYRYSMLLLRGHQRPALKSHTPFVKSISLAVKWSGHFRIATELVRAATTVAAPDFT